jgi:triosephosphate isomerase
MKRIVVGNWKMNLGPDEALLLAKRLDDKLEANPNTEVVLCAPAIDLYPLSKEINHKKFKLGAQNIHYLDHGPYTGEISGMMLKGLVQYTLVGHSERRAMGESDTIIAKKMSAAIRNGLTPVLCVGESLDERHHELSKKVVTDQITACLAQLTAPDVAQIVIAYEPVWAIGAGTPATPDQIAPCIRAIRATVEDLYGEESAGVRVIYGASVAAEFVQTIMHIPGVEGLLPGGASLNYEEFSSIVKAVQALD